jgi:hypothetical protein
MMGLRRYVGGRRRVWSGALTMAVLAAVAVGALAGAAGSAPQKKIYTVTPTTQPGPSLSGSLSWDLGNSSTGPFTIGSAEIRLTGAFPGFSITSVDGPAYLDGNVIKLRNIAVNPGGPPLRVTAHYTASCSGGTTSWVAEAKQSNDFLGTNNNFLNGSAKLTSLTATISACAYKLAFVGQPADASLATAIASEKVTTEAGNPAGTSVQVWAVRSDLAGAPTTDDIVPLNGVQVTVSTVAGTGGGSFSQTYVTSAGIATLTDVVIASSSSISPLGTYTLSATGGTVGDPATSGEFSVVTKVCPNDGTSTDECTASLSVQGNGGRGTLTYTASAVDLDASNSNQGATSLSLLQLAGAAPAQCGSAFAPLGPGVLIDTRPLAGKLIVTIAISKLDRQYTANNGLALLDVCIATNLPFTTKSGALSEQAGIEFIGLVPDCPATTDLSASGGTATEPSPCMVSRRSVGGGAVLVLELPNTGLPGLNGLEAYDPKLWG